VRTIRRARAEGASRGDLVYAVYAGVMVAAIVGFPILRTIVLYLAEPQVSSVLVDAGPAVSATVFALACAAFTAIGGIRGPAMLSSFLVFAVAGNGHPRRRTLLRPVVGAVVSLALLGAALTLLPGLVLASTGDASLVAAVEFGAAGVLAGVVCGGCWLLGQRASAAVRGWIVGGVLATWAVWAAVPGASGMLPWGWFESLFPSAGPGQIGSVAVGSGSTIGFALAGLGLLALAAVAAIPVLLDGLRGPALLAQAQRWQTAGTLAFTGDLATAMGEFRAVPRRGRGLAAIGRGGHSRRDGRSRRAVGSLLAMFARRDLAGSLRTPARFALACAGCLGFGLLIAVAVGASGAGLWLAACAAAVIGYLALGVWSDGFRHVVEVASAPPLYGLSTLSLLGLHALLPIVGGVLFSLAGVFMAAAFWAGAGALGPAFAPALAVAALSVLLLVLVRIYDSAKGPLPLTLMAPVPTPAGDASALVVAAWQADAVIIACLVVGATAATAAASVPGGIAVAAASAVVLGWMARHRVLTA
jgi:hypothetical protein